MSEVIQQLHVHAHATTDGPLVWRRYGNLRNPADTLITHK